MADDDSVVEWREIPEFPDYEVSNDGRVRRVTPPSNGRRPLYPLPYEIARTPDASGYPMVRLRQRGGRRNPHSLKVHRLVLLAFIGPPPSRFHQGAHWDGDKSNNSLNNLRWATPKENAEDSSRLGECPAGERHYRAKLTRKEIGEMRILRIKGMTYRSISEAFDINIATAFDAINGKSYRQRPTPNPDAS